MRSEKEGKLTTSGSDDLSTPIIYKVFEMAIMKIWAIGNPNLFLPA